MVACNVKEKSEADAADGACRSASRAEASGGPAGAAGNTMRSCAGPTSVC